MESFHKDKLDRLAKELKSVIVRHGQEEHLKYPEIIGLLEIIKIGYIDELYFKDINGGGEDETRN